MYLITARTCISVPVILLQTAFSGCRPRILRGPCGKMVNCIYNGSVKQRIRRAQELADLTEADGGILFAHWGCKGTIGASSLIKNSLENAGLPTMVLDGDGCNPANSSDGQVSTRLQAYLEMLSEGKEEKRS